MSRGGSTACALMMAAVLVLAFGAAGQESGVDITQVLESGPKGSLAIRATQGTAGGASPAHSDVEIDLIHRNQSIRHIEAQLDENAVVVVGDLPVGIGIRPIVTIHFAGVTYREIGPEMNADNPNRAMDVTVYEVTEEEPNWRVAMRHVVTSPSSQSVVVRETVVVENPGDRTWLGGEKDERDNRTSVRLILPEGVQNVSLDAGFHGWCCTRLDGNVLGVQMPLMPERVSYRFSYEVPVVGGQAHLQFAAPVLTSMLTVFVPENSAEMTPVGLTPGGMQATEFGAMRMFEGKAIAGGQSAGLTLSGLFAMDMPITPVNSDSPGSGSLMRIVAGVGLAALVVGAIVIVTMKKPKPESTA